MVIAKGVSRMILGEQREKRETKEEREDRNNDSVVILSIIGLPSVRRLVTFH